MCLVAVVYLDLRSLPMLFFLTVIVSLQYMYVCTIKNCGVGSVT